MQRLTIGLVAVLLAGITSPARAELVIYVQDTTLTSGGYGYLNVYLSGLSTDLFDTYQVTLSISGGGAVAFAPNVPQPDPNTPVYPDPNAAANGYQPYSYLYPAGWTSSNQTTAANYIFANDSLDSAAQVVGGQQTTGSGVNVFTITDLALTSEHAPLSDAAPTLATTSTLLASLLIQATPGYSGQFSVGLSFTPGTPMGPADTFFQNTGSNLTDVSQTLGSSLNFTGTITVSPASVPEPGSIVSGMTALLILAGFSGVHRLRRSRNAAA